MKFKFDAKLPHQESAINAVVDSFNGIKNSDSIFTVQKHQDLFGNIGYANNIRTFDWKNKLNENVKNIQRKNGLPIVGCSPDTQYPYLDIEMETGTGKTYVFLRTVLELNKKYGFKKFIILVPKIAIKKGISKTFEMTKDHFKNLYNNVDFSCFEYDSKNLNEVYSFARSESIQIMIMVVGSINKTENNIFYKESEKLSGDRPFDLIKKLNPIIIVDEPQETDSGINSSEAIDSLNPLFKLRYSATFSEKNNKKLIYKLDAVEAAEKKLVKQLAVHSTTISDNHLEIKLHKIIDNKAYISLKREEHANRIYYLNDTIPLYSKNSLNNPYIQELSETYVILSNGQMLTTSTNKEEMDLYIKESQIRYTIKYHLEKQLELKNRGIKVLSLFFIDKVKNYIDYDGKIQKNGIYADLFEKLFVEEINKNQKYLSLFGGKNIEELSKEIHGGYFAKSKSSDKFQDSSGKTEADEKVYKLIMESKEKLLSFDTKLSFIFSHSALREGWDNPNVFQICTLNKTNSELKKRQEIGRGLRICVDQDGNRIHDEEINKLIVLVNENYEKFARELQRDLKENGIEFGRIERSSFEKIIINNSEIGLEKSNEIFDFINKEFNWIDINGQITENFVDDITVDMDEAVSKLSKSKLDVDQQLSRMIIQELSDNSRTKELIKNAREYKQVQLFEDTLNSDYFNDLWNTINKKTDYIFNLDVNKLIDISIQKINARLSNEQKAYVDNKKANIYTKREGVFAEEEKTYEREYKSINISTNTKPDIVKNAVDETHLTRQTIIKIIKNSDLKNYYFNVNSDEAQNILIDILKETLREISQENVHYITTNKMYDVNLLKIHLDSNKEIIPNDLTVEINEKNENKKTIFNFIKCDSRVEKEFLLNSLTNESIKIIIKLPPWFQIKTPVGYYNPDWAIYYSNGKKAIIETKGTENIDELRNNERQKICYAKMHFDTINKEYGTNIIYCTVNKLDSLIDIMDGMNHE